MNSEKMIKGRRSIRNYKNIKVEREILEEIVDLSRYSPSWGNSQICKYHIIDEDKKIIEIANTCVFDFGFNTSIINKSAGVVLISYTTGKSGKAGKYGVDYSREEERYWESFDVGIACQTFCLAAHSKGIGTCIMGVIDKETLKNILGLNENEKVGVLISYGYPDESPTPPKRKELNEILQFNY